MALSEGELFACYRRLEKPLYNVLFRWLWQAQDCQDVIHDAFLRVWRERARVDAARLDKLVWTAALNLSRNKLRWRKLWRLGAMDIETAHDRDPVEAAAQSQREMAFRRALRILPRHQREVLLLSEFGGLSTAEIANVLNIPAGTVGSRKHAALSQLRRELSENNHD
jgi:RNA polymerase sigma-70 factor (ECF subfamily)